MTDDDFDDQSTPPHAAPIAIADQPSGLTDSQREWFARRLNAAAPLALTRDTPTPTSLLARTTTPDEQELLRHIRIAESSTMLEEFVVKIYAETRELRRDLNAKIQHDSSDNQNALEELRTLLSKPPNGRVAALQERVDKLERSSQSADPAAAFRLKELEGDAAFAKRAAQGVIVFLILAIGAAGIWLGVRQERLDNVIESVKELGAKVDNLIRWQRKDTTP